MGGCGTDPFADDEVVEALEAEHGQGVETGPCAAAAHHEERGLAVLGAGVAQPPLRILAAQSAVEPVGLARERQWRHVHF